MQHMRHNTPCSVLGAGTRVRAVRPAASPHALPTSAIVDLESSVPESAIEADLVLWTAGSAPATGGGARAGFPFPTTPKGSVQTVRAACKCVPRFEFGREKSACNALILLQLWQPRLAASSRHTLPTPIAILQSCVVIFYALS
jgi:hypothetical protein